MGILAVAELLRPLERQKQLLAQPRLTPHVGGDGHIGLGRVGIGSGREPQPQFRGGIALPGDLLQHLGVVRGVANHRHRDVVLGGAPQHRGAADVDLLGGLGERHPLAGDRLAERIEVHAHQIDREDPQPAQGAHVLLVVAPGQQGPVDGRMERLDPSVADFREARHLADAGGGDPLPLEELLRAARGDHLPAPILQCAGELRNARLVAYAE